MSSLTVGLTGGLASGKSTVSRWLGDAGHTVIDADRLVADLYRPGEPGALAVSRLFGEELIGADGRVDHRRLAERVFDDRESRERLEAAIHPLVRDRFRQIAAETPGVVVLEATLLIEAGFADDFDLLVAVQADVERRVARAVDRGMTEADARSRLAAQSDDATRGAAADVVLDNNEDLAALRLAVERLLAEIDRRAARGRHEAPSDA